MMRRIEVATEGAVTTNDLFDAADAAEQRRRASIHSAAAEAAA